MKKYKSLKNNRILFSWLFITFFFVSCDDYLDVDTDTDNPTKATLPYLLSNIEKSVAEFGDYNLNSGQTFAVYAHQMCAREDSDQYGLKSSDIPLQNDWNSMYYTITDIDDLIKTSESNGNFVYAGIGQILKAYLLASAVDIWGDIPFTEANKFSSNGLKNAKFDNQKEIYKAVFTLIDQGKTNVLKNTGVLKPAADDIFYGGSVAKWEKFANTFKLKLYNQLRLTTDFDQAGFNALLAENKFFSSNADDFEFKHNNDITKSNERNKLFIESYESTQFGSYISPWFYEILKGVNPKIHTGTVDPRMKYYFFIQLKGGAFPPDQGNTTTGDPKADYWDKSTGFFSIRFGSVGPNRDHSVERSVTYPGIFLCGGRYDDGSRYNPSGGSALVAVDDKAGTGAAPRRILTYDEMLFIQAELIQAGKMTGNAATKLTEAINANFAKIDKVCANAKLSTQTVPALVGTAAVTTFINKIMTEFNAGTADKKMEVIMTQKWVATAGDCLDQYTDYRRTGFPVLADPNSSTREYQLDNGDAFPLLDSQTVLNNQYQTSLYWPQEELNANSKAPGQKNPQTYKIFWDN